MFDRILVYFSFIKCGRLAFEKAEVKDKFESELNYSLYHWRTLFAFIVPSLIGALLFMTPLKIGAAFTIPIAAIAVAMQTLLSSSVTSIVTVVVTTTALMSIAVTLFKPKAILRIEFFRHPTQKEAAIIGTTFSSVSIAFCLVVIGQVNLEHLFAPFYLTVCVAGVVAALILPRLPPLRFIPFLKLLQIPEAQEASKSIVVGFADMFIPSILAANSIELFTIFLLRTLVTLPVIAAMAHWLL